MSQAFSTRGGYDAVLVDDIANAPSIEAETVKHGHWIFKERTELVPTGEIGVLEGHILHKTSKDKPFTLKDSAIVILKKHKVVRKPYCSECGDHGDDENDATPFCKNCGAIMDGGADNE